MKAKEVELDMTGLERARRRATLTQAELADRAGVQRKSVWNIETGRSRTPHPNTLRKLAVVLGCDPSTLNPALEPEPQEAAVG